MSTKKIEIPKESYIDVEITEHEQGEWRGMMKGALIDLRERVEALERKNTRLELINGAYAYQLTPDEYMQVEKVLKRYGIVPDPIVVKDPQ